MLLCNCWLNFFCTIKWPPPYFADVDCGGSCSPCLFQQLCNISSDCVTAWCTPISHICGYFPNFTSPAGSLFNGQGGQVIGIFVVATVIDASAVTYTLSSGSLPVGCTLNGISGLIAGSIGRMSAITTFNFNITATSVAYASNITSVFTMVIIPDVKLFTPSGVVLTTRDGFPITPVTISANVSDGTALSFAVVGSSFPAGLVLNSGTGVISGTPARIQVNTTFTFNITATSNTYAYSVSLQYVIFVFLRLDGFDAAHASANAKSLVLLGITTDGVYYINLPTVGATLVYCLLNIMWDGGGWMMAMKAAQGTTFQYTSPHWTTNTLLNQADTTQNNGDAKYNTMNYFSAVDMMARWPDVSTNGGSIPNTGTWTWEQKSFSGGIPTTLINFFNNPSTYRLFLQDAATFSGWSCSVFSGQKDLRFYGYNFESYQLYAPYIQQSKVRWGFGWNENDEGLWTGPGSLALGGAPGSDDASGGIGMDVSWGSFSAGDKGNQAGGCPPTSSSTGFNRAARVEMYIR